MAEKPTEEQIYRYVAAITTYCPEKTGEAIDKAIIVDPKNGEYVAAQAVMAVKLNQREYEESQKRNKTRKK